MLKKSSDRKVRIGVKCGDCLHYDKVKSGVHSDVCVKLGVREKANAPDCFHPDFYKLNVTKSPDVIEDLAKVLRHFKPSQLRILAFTLTRGAKLIERHGLKFGQVVYFSLGHDYLSHYFKGYIVGGTDENIIVSSKLKKCKTNTVGQFNRDSLLTREQWKEKKTLLISSGKVMMTEQDRIFHRKLPLAELMDSRGRVKIVVPETFDYEPPTLDTANPEWFDRSQRKASKKKDKGYRPITSIEDIPSRKSKASSSNYVFDSSKLGTAKPKRGVKK